MFYRIPTFVINLKKRNDRLISIQKEFEGKPEFSFRVVEAYEDQNGAFGLWNTIQYILRHLSQPENDFILLCEDDHEFTNFYSKRILFQSIEEAKILDADVLMGGVSWFDQSVQVNDNLFLVDTFSATQFIIIFRKFFDSILGADFSHNDTADYKISALSQKKFAIFPFISVQKEFGYSDTTYRISQAGRVTSIFESASGKLRMLNKVRMHYIFHAMRNTYKVDVLSKSIPTYIVNTNKEAKPSRNIGLEFIHKPEFDVKIISALPDKIRLAGVVPQIKEIVKSASQNDEDMIIVCSEDHHFTSDYSKEYFFENIIKAYKLGANFLSAGTYKFGSGVPVTKNLVWVDWCSSLQFLVLFKSVYKKILDFQDYGKRTGTWAYNGITSNKMILYPFISVPLYSGINENFYGERKFIAEFFKESNSRMQYLQDAYNTYRVNFESKKESLLH